MASAQQLGDNSATQKGDGLLGVGGGGGAMLGSGGGAILGSGGGAMLGQASNWNGDGAFDSAVLFGAEGLGEMKMEEDGLFDF